ncbi:hypothetical protein L3Q82_024431 [Scortum barcoo]|uniref:Uncharacterized protein n=1 Tax=Scortum barcoo TaxID=214431 RepID=A0ACB8WQ29_9TELE|nr:hypothetical protein L3Q82_024431 [Scortum barcoo]
MGKLEVTLEIGSHKFNWKVFVGRIHDSFLLGLDTMQAADMTVLAGRKVFVGNNPVPSWVIEDCWDPKGRDKTAFITRYGLYEYTRMPFGLCNAPGTFQRAMELVLRGFQWKTLLVYLDDIILGGGVEENLQCLADVFEHLHSYGALGLCNYYLRRFVPAFAELASPLTDLLKKTAEFQWGEPQQNTFLQLKERLTTAPVLAYPAPTGNYILDTDASNHSIGAVLSQFQWGEERVISYASSHLTPAQQRYCVTRRELLAVVRFTRQFRHLLLGRKFLLRTDHNSLTWLFRFKHPEGQLARWFEELSQYDFEIEHRAGRQHANADTLSRCNTEGPTNCDCYQAGKEATELPCQGCSHCQRLHDQWVRFEEDVDDVVPLAIRQITVRESENSPEPQQQVEADHHASTVK